MVCHGLWFESACVAALGQEAIRDDMHPLVHMARVEPAKALKQLSALAVDDKKMTGDSDPCRAFAGKVQGSR